MLSAQSDGFSIMDPMALEMRYFSIKEVFMRGPNVRFGVHNGVTGMQNKTILNQKSMPLIMGRNLHKGSEPELTCANFACSE